MATYVALLRAINVGGHNRIAMVDLRKMTETLGFDGVKTILQSGNLVFEAPKRSGAGLEQMLETETTKRLKVTVDYLIRTADEWKSIIARNPFPKEAGGDPGHLHVMCLKEAPAAKKVKALQAAIKGPEYVRADGCQLYMVYPAGMGTSKLTNAVIEKLLNTRGTARNWNTVMKLAALTEG